MLSANRHIDLSKFICAHSHPCTSCREVQSREMVNKGKNLPMHVYVCVCLCQHSSWIGSWNYSTPNSIMLKMYLFNEVAYQNAVSTAGSITCKISDIRIPLYIPFIILTSPCGIPQCCASYTEFCHHTGSSERLYNSCITFLRVVQRWHLHKSR
jgi:hypothetical protein